MSDAVWMTGLGTVTPLGHSLAAIADNVFAGRSATRLVHDRQGEKLVPFVGTQVDQIPVPRGIDGQSFAALTRLEQFALSSAATALDDAGLRSACEGLRVGVILGQGGEWYRQWLDDSQRSGQLIRHPQDEHRQVVALLQQHLGLAGPTATIGSACASGNYAIALGRQWVRQGLVDICLAIGADIACPITRANFHNLRALSRRIDDPQHASRPFDADRDGFVMGEGAAAFVLESASAARGRGANCHAEVAGFGASSDSFHMVIPSDNPQPAADAMRSALASAEVEPHEIDYVNAHATSTTVGDRAEARALRLVFGQHTMATPVSSTKSMTGHLVSASAAVEAVICIAALDRQAIPPTINLDQPDPDCDLCHVPNQAIDHRVRVTLSNSFGFGGSNTSLVLRKAA
jgi:3-oxoacyl-[acyl-carrier-protein] synthase II